MVVPNDYVYAIYLNKGGDQTSIPTEKPKPNQFNFKLSSIQSYIFKNLSYLLILYKKKKKKNLTKPNKLFF